MRSEMLFPLLYKKNKLFNGYHYRALNTLGREMRDYLCHTGKTNSSSFFS